MNIPVYQDIAEAFERIQAVIHQTPVLTSETYNRRFQSSLFFKCENFQKSGSFKFRGASNTLLQLSEEEVRRGVATHSSGNHGQAVAKAARVRGCRAVIVMPKNAPDVKVRAVREYGGEVIFCEPTLESREQTLRALIEREELVVVHPFADPRVIAGQGTAAVELMREVPDLDLILTPVGGGGLISGCAIAVAHSREMGCDRSVPHPIEVIGCEPEMADDACRSFQSGLYTVEGNRPTIADGLRATIGEINFEIIRTYVSDMVSVSESSIVEEMKFFWERMNLIIEPSCAVPLAALRLLGDVIGGKRVGVIITGGNLDLDGLPWMQERESV